MTWDVMADPTCCLCQDAAGSRDHLFFSCCYTDEFRSRVSKREDNPGSAAESCLECMYLSCLASPNRDVAWAGSGIG